MEKDKEKSDSSHVTSQFSDDEINLLDLFIVLVKHKKLILSITLGVAIITAIISLIMRPIYRAETKILPPQTYKPLPSEFLAQIGEVAGIPISTKTTSELYIGLLKSRPVLDNIIDRFNLMKVYKTESREDARKRLLSTLKAQEDKKSGIITIGVEDKDPKRAAEMANAFVEELKNISKRLAVTEASQKRLFLEEQLENVKDELIKAEESLKSFGERTGAIKIDEQTRAVIESIAKLRAQIAAKEVELRAMRTYATPQNPELRKAEEELKGLKAELIKLEAKSGKNPEPLTPTGRIPELGIEYARKLRDLKFRETLYEILLKMYEQAKLEEASEPSIIQVIEKAIPPEKKVKPKRKLMVMIATITGFFFSIFMAFFMEYIERVSKDPKNKEQFEALKKYANFRLRK